MEILTFEISGKFAHFRKYFANNTALSFSIPPRTTIMGILAAIAGYPKDSYYESLSSDKIRIGIQNISLIKKSFHRLNLLKIIGYSDFRGRQGHTQTPFEVISGEDIKSGMVNYRVYLSHYEGGKEIYNNIKQILIESYPKFNLSLGTANFQATISSIKLYNENDIEEKILENTEIELYSACNSDFVSELLYTKEEHQKYTFVEEEMMPCDFKANDDREVIKMTKLLFTTGNVPLKVRLSGKIYSLKKVDEILNIQFIE